MKRFATVMAVLAALVLALAFTGCGNKTAYAFSSSEGSTITCYKDGTCDFSLKSVDGNDYAGSGTYKESSQTIAGQTGSIITIEGTTKDEKDVHIVLSGSSPTIGSVITVGTTVDYNQIFKTK